jgi:acetolactate synthase I/II/III large subunit
MISGADYILYKLHSIGVKHIFGIPGSHIDPLFVAAVNSDIEHVINCHELSAAYMADGYSRASNKLGVVIGIGGPGANNMITAINTARIEKSPLLVITGDVPAAFSNVPGFQCSGAIGTNDDAIFKTITKYSRRTDKVENLSDLLEEAICIALTPPFGPSHLIVPFDVLKDKTLHFPKVRDYSLLKFWENESSGELVASLKELLLSDKKIIFWIGGSMNKEETSQQITTLAEKFCIPVATSYETKGVFDESNPLALGNFGYAGSSIAKDVMLSDSADVIIGFDIEQNERNTLNWNSGLYANKKIILINFPSCFSDDNFGETHENNPFYILKSLHSLVMSEKYNTNARKNWFETIVQPTKPKVNPPPLIHHRIVEPQRLIEILNKEMPDDTILFVDSGNHRIFPGIYWKAKTAAAFYTAATIAPLGWAIAAGIGCKFMRSEPVVIFTGDGCMQMHGIELKTAVKHQLPVLVIVNNNNAFGSVHSRYSKVSKETSDITLITEIDWVLFVKSFGAKGYDVTTEEHFTSLVREFLLHPQLTVLNVSTPVAPYIPDLSIVKPAFN